MHSSSSGVILFDVERHILELIRSLGSRWVLILLFLHIKTKPNLGSERIIDRSSILRFVGSDTILVRVLDWAFENTFIIPTHFKLEAEKIVCKSLTSYHVT